MNKKLYNIIKIITLLLFISFVGYSQCPTQQIVGQSLVKNGDFSGGNVGFTHDVSYTDFIACGSSCYSTPGKIYVGTSPSLFNSAFPHIQDHSTNSDNSMMMVDGLCTSGIDIWRQTVTVSPNTNYYFIYWATVIGSASPGGSLRINIDGVNYTGLSIPSGAANIGIWTPSTVQWTSCSSCTSANISIQNTETSGCSNAVDFALDDISISAGCLSNGIGPIPNLGPDRTLCGGNSTITLTSGISYTTGLRYNWSNNATTSSIVINSPGTYSLCVDSSLGSGNYSCKKSSIVKITNNYSINLNGPYNLCSPSFYTLDTKFTGSGVSYLWYKDGILLTNTTSSLLVSSQGFYSVNVNDISCGTQTAGAIVSTSGSNPINGSGCFPTTVTLSVSGTGKYKWYTSSIGGSVLGIGGSLNITSTGVYYAGDTSSFRLVVGPSTTGHNFINVANNNPGDNGSRLFFGVSQNIVLDTISVFYNNYYCPTPGAATDKVGIDIFDPSGVKMTGSPFVVSVPCSFQNNGGWPAPLAKIPIKLNIPIGNGFMIKSSSLGGLNNIVKFLNEPATGGTIPPVRLYNYPTTYSNVLTIISNSTSDYNLYYHPDAYPGYFDMKITVGTPCDRIPVYANSFCPLDISGKEIVKKVIKEENIRLYPNPFEESIILESSSKEKFVIIYTIYDLVGNILDNGYMYSDSKKDIGKNIKSGSYIISLEYQETINMYKIIKLN